MDSKITLTVKLQTIYYEDNTGNLGIFNTGEKERITQKQAKEILYNNGINFNSVFQVRKEDVTLELTNEQLQDMIVK